MKIKENHMKPGGAVDFYKAINLAEIYEIASFISDDIAYKESQ